MDGLDMGPIFIAGLDRTGKTRLRDLLITTYPHISISRRTYMWPRFYNRFGDLSKEENLQRCLSAMLNQDTILALNPDQEWIRQEFRQGEPSYARLFGLFHQHYAESHGKTRWGDQLGFIEQYASPIFEAFPNARMIHMIRNPRSRFEEAASISKQKKGRAGISLARWMKSARLAKQNRQKWPQNYIVVHYEAFVEQTERTLREICDFIDEEFAPEMVKIQPERFKSNGRVSKPEKAFFHLLARQQMASFGYPLEKLNLSTKENLALYFYDGPVNLAGMLYWFVIGRRRPEKPVIEEH